MMHSKRSRFQIIHALFCMLAALSFQYPAFAQGTDNAVVLDIAPSAEFPRNSEGAFVTLKDGAIFYAYSQFYGGTADHSKGRIVAIESRDGGLTWNTTPRTIVENIGTENVMSVSLLRLANGEIAIS